MKKLLLLLSLLTCALLFTACKDDDGTITILKFDDVVLLKFDANPSAPKTLGIVSNVEWQVSSNESWCTVSPESSDFSANITVTVSNYAGTQKREALITLSPVNPATGLPPVTCKVLQDGVAVIL